MRLNQKILYCRKKKGMSQEILAEHLGVSRQAVSKWETGDAVPEITKLLLLAKEFGVTTDWLLSEEEPENVEETTRANFRNIDGETPKSDFEETTQSSTNFQKESSSARFEKSVEEWMNVVPGVLGKMVRRFGWIAGIYIALIGTGIFGFGCVAKLITNSMISGFNQSIDGIGPSSGGVTFYDENGNQMSAKESAELMKLFKNSGTSLFEGTSGGFNSISSGFIENNPVSVMAGILMIIGLSMMIGGSILALVWRSKSTKK